MADIITLKATVDQIQRQLDKWISLLDGGVDDEILSESLRFLTARDHITAMQIAEQIEALIHEFVSAREALGTAMVAANPTHRLPLVDIESYEFMAQQVRKIGAA